MRKITHALLLSAFTGIVFLSGCKSKKEEPVPEEPVKETTTAAKQSDQTASAELDETMNQVHDIINNGIGGGKQKRLEAADLPCGVVSLDSSTRTAGNARIYKLQYGNRTPCGYKYKSGLVSFALQKGLTFNESGAVFVVTFTDYKVETAADNSLLTLNGSMYVTNVSGGYTWETVTASKTITHKVRGTLNVTFANKETRGRKYYQLKEYKNVSSGWAGLSLSVSGDTLISSRSVSETGTTLEGNYTYQTEISIPFNWENCGTGYGGPYVLKKGKARMNVSVPAISPAYFEVEAGHKWNTSSPITSALVQNCESNAYKITTLIGTATSSSYQLY